MARPVDESALIGRTIGAVTVLAFAGRRRTLRPGDGRCIATTPTWRCRCARGHTIEVRNASLVGPNAQSLRCRTCVRSDIGRRLGARSRKHGLADTKLYTAWHSMMSRCNDPATWNYSRYGGRGIQVCERWAGANGIIAFAIDMGAPPSHRHQLERIDNDGPYTPDNCRWATPKEQARNRRNTRWITFRGERRPLPEWCEILNLPYKRTYYRLFRFGLSVEEAFAPAARGAVLGAAR